MSSNPEFQDCTPVPADRSERRSVSMRGYVILADHHHHEITLLDLSYEGCGIETVDDLQLEPGQELKLSVLRRGAIDAVVRWRSGNKAGLAFTMPAESARRDWQQRAQRVALAANVSLRRIGRSTFHVTVNDASPEGCRVQLVERPGDGERVLVKFDGLEPLEAEVAWTDNFTAGLRYLRPIHPAVFELLVERLKG